MEEVTNRSVRCPFCGQVRTFKVIYNDGHDPWSGRFSEHMISTKTTDEGCTCALGQLVFNGKFNLQTMCFNCAYRKGQYCENPQISKEVSKFFECEKLKIKDLGNSCAKHTFNANLILQGLLRNEVD